MGATASPFGQLRIFPVEFAYVESTERKRLSTYSEYLSDQQDVGVRLPRVEDHMWQLRLLCTGVFSRTLHHLFSITYEE